MTSMTNQGRRLLGLLILLFCAVGVRAATPTGEIGAHDPSRIVKCDGKYFYYVTGPNVPMRYSTDMIHWVAGPSVLSGVPDWAHQAVPEARGDFVWAPDVLFIDHRYFLYYSYSTFGSRVSVIGLVTSPTLDPTRPGYHWADQGAVIRSDRSSGFNAIDPCPILDTGGHLWLSFGSWNHGGIQIVPLDRNTGKPAGPPATIVAGQRTGPEGSFVWYHGGFYYVFENEGLCCQGMNSTYRIMVGRARAITGPYLDKNGKELAMGGGTLFLGTEGRRFGPGQAGILYDGRRDRLTFHYYDGAANGRPTLGLGTLAWDKSGWPRAVADAPPAGSGLPEGHYVLVSKATGAALTVHGGDKDGTPVSLSLAGNEPTPWNISPVGDGCDSLSSLANAKFLDLDHCNPAEGTTIDQYRWLGSDCQRWRIEPAGGNAYRIVSKSTGKVVAVSAGDGTTGTPVQEQTWTGSSSQKWELRRIHE